MPGRPRQTPTTGTGSAPDTSAGSATQGEKVAESLASNGVAPIHLSGINKPAALLTYLYKLCQQNARFAPFFEKSVPALAPGSSPCPDLGSFCRGSKRANMD